jgi:hypothetical protein
MPVVPFKGPHPFGEKVQVHFGSQRPKEARDKAQPNPKTDTDHNASEDK